MLAFQWRPVSTALFVFSFLLCLSLCPTAVAEPEPAPQMGGNAASISGSVVDPSGSVVVGATVTIKNPVSAYERTATTDSQGRFNFTNVPYNPYHMTVTATGFAIYTQDVDARSSVPMNLTVNLDVNASTTTVNVEAQGGDLIENDSTFHTDIDKSLLETMPLEGQSSGLSAAVTEGTPGVAADSNGQLHGLGDHAENSISMDGQPMTDQISKVFSNQLPLDAVQSMEVISGAPPGRVWRQDERGDQRNHAIGTGTDDAAWRGDGLVRSIWDFDAGIQRGVRRQELGKFYLREWAPERTVSGSAGIFRDARQGQ